MFASHFHTVNRKQTRIDELGRCKCACGNYLGLLGNQIIVVVDVKLVENRNCEKSSEKAMTKLERLYSFKEGTAVNAATL